jgi:hypothetical protein
MALINPTTYQNDASSAASDTLGNETAANQLGQGVADASVWENLWSSIIQQEGQFHPGA